MAGPFRIAAIGEEHLVEGYRLAGALVRAAEDDEQMRRAWRDLPVDAELVFLTPRAVRAIGDERADRMTAVLPT